MYRNNWDEYKAISTLYGDKTSILNISYIIYYLIFG